MVCRRFNVEGFEIESLHMTIHSEITKYWDREYKLPIIISANYISVAQPIKSATNPCWEVQNITLAMTWD